MLPALSFIASSLPRSLVLLVIGQQHNNIYKTYTINFKNMLFKQLDSQRAVELTISRIAANINHTQQENKTTEEESSVLSDRIFVRYKEKMVKIIVTDILYIEADRNYSRIFTGSKEYFLSITLKTIEEKMDMHLFMRVHRSYLINITHVDEVGENYVTIAKKEIPLGAGMKEQLMQRIKTL